MPPFVSLSLSLSAPLFLLRFSQVVGLREHSLGILAFLLEFNLPFFVFVFVQDFDIGCCCNQVRPCASFCVFLCSISIAWESPKAKILLNFTFPKYSPTLCASCSLDLQFAAKSFGSVVVF